MELKNQQFQLWPLSRGLLPISTLETTRMPLGTSVYVPKTGTWPYKMIIIGIAAGKATRDHLLTPGIGQRWAREEEASVRGAVGLTSRRHANDRR